jgi:hypothetical protein
MKGKGRRECLAILFNYGPRETDKTRINPTTMRGKTLARLAVLHPQADRL